MKNPSMPSVDPNINALLIGGGAQYGNAQNLEDQGDLLQKGLDLTGKDKPTVLIVPSARWKSEGAVGRIVDRLVDYYEHRGLGASALHGFLYQPHDMDTPSFEDLPIDPSRMPVHEELADKIGGADYIFTLGGDSNRMLNQVWRPHGIDTMLVDAAHRGAVLSGTSAGALAWFDKMQSNGSSLQNDGVGGYHLVEGVGLLKNTIGSAHYDTTPSDNPGHPRKQDFEKLMHQRRNRGELGIGIDNDAALQITNGGKLEVIRGSTGTGPRNVNSIYYPRPTQDPIKRVIDPTTGAFRITDLTS